MMLSGLGRETRRERAMKLLTSVGLSHRASFSPLNISGGERQRVAMRALANDPKIIIADEPTGNLDLKNSDEVMNILTNLNREGRTLIMVTHNPEITENCSRVIRLRDGRISGERIMKTMIAVLSLLTCLLLPAAMQGI